MNSDIANLPPHLQRVAEELQDLNIKINALIEFTSTNTVFNNLPELDKNLLMTQLSCMQAYSYVLSMRLAR